MSLARLTLALDSSELFSITFRVPPNYVLFIGSTISRRTLSKFVLNYVTSQTRPDFGLHAIMGRFIFKSKSKQKREYKKNKYSSPSEANARNINSSIIVCGGAIASE